MNNLLTLWSDNVGLSAAIWLTLIMTLMYFGRLPAHQILNSLGSGLRRLFRLSSRSLYQLEKHMTLRNREVLLNAARNDAERRIEREFSRIQTLVSRDLAGYPALQRQLSSTIESIESNYQQSGDNPPLPPAWSEVVSTIAELPSHGDPAVAKVLTNIQQAVEETHKETLKTWQASAAKRHDLLGKMQPQWRTLNDKLESVSHTIDNLDERSHQLDKQMQQYEEVRRGEDSAIRSLTSSSLTQFFISGLVLTIALLGGLINFQLIAMPMSEMVGGTSYIGSMKTSDIAALVIILIEVAMGLFLLESMRITRLFPVIASMDDKMRRRMMIISLTILTVLASIEASLAYMRDLLALDREALQQSLTAVAASSGVINSHAEFRWIPSIGQMVMGFILPFALAFIAIPLESFIQSLRTVLGVIFTGLLRLVSIACRGLGNLLANTFTTLTHAYDLMIMLPLAIERAIAKRLNHQDSETTESIAEQLPEVEEVNDSPEVTLTKKRRNKTTKKSDSETNDHSALAV